jgi:hypothetical protein
LQWSPRPPHIAKVLSFSVFALCPHGCTMRACHPQQQQHSDTTLTVLDIVAGHISSAYTLSQLSVVNKRCRAICSEHASHQLQALLLPVLQQAAGQPKGAMHRHHMSMINWLCSTARQEAFAAASEAVAAVSNVPAAAVRILTAAGVRVCDSHVIDAALKQQPGAELWVQARVALHGPTAAVGSSDAKLCAAFSSAQAGGWKGVTAAARSSCSPGGTASAGAAAGAAASFKPSLLEFVACYATRFRVSAGCLLNTNTMLLNIGLHHLSATPTASV